MAKKAAPKADKAAEPEPEQENDAAPKETEASPSSQGTDTMDAEAVEVVEAVEADEPVHAPKKQSGKGIGKKAAAVALAIILVSIAVIGVLIYVKTPQAPVAKISVSETDLNNIQAGKQVTFDASRSTNEQVSGGGTLKSYSWNFGDNQKADGKSVTHVFLKKGTYKVSLTVTNSDGLSSRAELQVTVVGMVVVVPNAKIGDVISYDMAFSMDFSDPNGLWSYTEETHPTPFTTVTMTASVTSVHMELDPSQRTENTIVTSKSDAEDGFANTHSCVDRKTSQAMSFKGWAIVKMTPKSGPSQTANQSLSGDSKSDEHLYTDLSTNRTIKSSRVSTYSMGLGSGGKTSFQVSGSDVGTSYPKKREEFTIDVLRSNRTFRTGDTGTFPMGGSSLIWDIAGEDNLNGEPCLKLHMTLDQDTMTKYSMTACDFTLWLSSEFSAPLGITMSMAGGSTTSSYSFVYTSIYKSYTMGSVEVPFGTCTASTSDGHVYAKFPNVDFNTPDQYGPAMGQSSPSLATYPLPDAVNYAKTNSPGLRQYLSSHPDAFLVDSYFNKSSGYPTWNLTFGVKGTTAAYNVIVTQSSVKSQGDAKVSEVGRTIKEYPNALTFSGAEQVLQSRPDIKNQVYSGGQIDLNKYSFGAKSDTPGATPGGFSTDNEADATEYFFYVKANDGSYYAGVDAGNGQVLFITTHTNG